MLPYRVDGFYQIHERARVNAGSDVVYQRQPQFSNFYLLVRVEKHLLFYVLFQPEEVLHGQSVHQVKIGMKILAEELHELVCGHLPAPVQP